MNPEPKLSPSPPIRWLAGVWLSADEADRIAGAVRPKCEMQRALIQTVMEAEALAERLNAEYRQGIEQGMQ